MAGRSSMHIECATDTCTNYVVVPFDSRWPKRWVCPVCEDAQLEQEAEVLAQRELTSGLDRPIKRMADF